MTEEVKKEIAEAAVKLVEYVHDGNFEGLIVSGGSNQLSRSLFTLAWQKRFTGEAMPKIYVFDRATNARLYKLDTAEEHGAENQEWLEKKLAQLDTKKNENLCYVDDFSMTGGKYVNLKTRFEELGFTKIKFAFFGATPISEPHFDENVFVGTLDLETTREFLTMSIQIKGMPSFEDILKQVEATAETHRGKALAALKEIGQTIRMK